MWSRIHSSLRALAQLPKLPSRYPLFLHLPCLLAATGNVDFVVGWPWRASGDPNFTVQKTIEEVRSNLKSGMVYEWANSLSVKLSPGFQF